MAASLERVFISHSHVDAALARAFKEAILAIFGKAKVSFSSDKEVGGGIEPGENWLGWIYEQVATCQEALLLLTPYSVGRPWPMWEAGAVGGVALAARRDPAAGRAKSVTPVVFQVATAAIPSPFVVTELVDGQSVVHLNKLLGTWMSRYDFEGATGTVVDATLKETVPGLKQRIDTALETTPAAVSDATVEEWCRRLDLLKSEKRFGEVRHLHHWIRLMYEGPARKEGAGGHPLRRWTEQDAEVPWDVRLHLRLGELYLSARERDEGIRQLELARRLAPMDVFTLHRLGRGYLDAGRRMQARGVLDRILDLDPEALQWNAEVAGLQGRYWKEEALEARSNGHERAARDSFRKACEAYQAALDRNPNSYYMADNVGQMALQYGDENRARKAYEAARVALDNADPSLWSLATELTAAIVLGTRAQDDPGVERALQGLSGLREKDKRPEDLDSVVRGLRELGRALALDAAVVEGWIAVIR